MSTGGIADGNKGWRLALRHALGDVAQSEGLQPRALKKKQRDADLPSLDLFDED